MAENLSEIISCKHCHNIAPMEIKGDVNDMESVEEEDGPNYEHGYFYQILKCPACKEVNIRRYFWHDHMESGDEVNYEYLYPKNKNFPLGMPIQILKSYEKADKIKAIDAEYFALELRKILELICADKMAKKGKLAVRIKDLADKGVIPNNLVEVAEGLKNIANIGAHTEIGTFSKKEIPITEALCNALLEYIYTAPYLASEAAAKLKALRAPLKRK